MSDIAIRVENLGKQYRIGKRERYRTLRDTITDTGDCAFPLAAERQIGERQRRARAYLGAEGRLV